MHLIDGFLNEEWTRMKKLALAAMLFAATGSSAFAGHGGEKCTQFLFWEICVPAPTQKHPVAAPEIDPASALGALALMGGGLAVLRGRRSKGTAV
jgi:hypothetical protein